MLKKRWVFSFLYFFSAIVLTFATKTYPISENWNLKKVFQNNYGEDLQKISLAEFKLKLQSVPELRNQFVSIFAANITTMNPWKVVEFLKMYPDMAYEVASVTAPYISDVPAHLVRVIGDTDQRAYDLFIKIVLEKQMQLAYKTLRVLVDYDATHERLLINYIQNGLQKRNNNDWCCNSRLIKLFCFYPELLPTSKDPALTHVLQGYYLSNTPVSHKNLNKIPVRPIQSYGHMKKNMKKIVQGFGLKISLKHSVIAMLDRLLVKEKEEQEKGNYTFVHAQQWHWHLLAEIYKMLWELIYQEKINDYQFLRFQKKASETQQDIEAKKRDDIMLTGRTDSNRPDLLFMNHALFGNTRTSGSCSMGYFLDNHDMSRISITIRDLFEMFGLSHLYDTYEEQFTSLTEIHKSANKYGNMLLLSFTPDQLKECVFVAHPGGKKRTVKVYGEETDDLQLILDTLKNFPEAIDNSDQIEYCMALTQDLALDPCKGPRIYAFHTAEEELMQKYEHVRNTIFDMLKEHHTADIEHARNSITAGLECHKERQQKGKISTYKENIQHIMRKLKRYGFRMFDYIYQKNSDVFVANCILALFELGFIGCMSPLAVKTKFFQEHKDFLKKSIVGACLLNRLAQFFIAENIDDLLKRSHLAGCGLVILPLIGCWHLFKT